MNNLQDKVSLIQILGVVVPVVCLFISHRLGIKVSELKYEKSVLEKRYFDFYVPFIKLLYQNFAWDILPHEYDNDTREEFMNLINHNIHYLDYFSLDLYPHLYTSYGQMLMHEKYPELYPQATLEFDTNFRKIAHLVLIESTSISDELKLPTLAMPFLRILNDTAKDSEN